MIDDDGVQKPKNPQQGANWLSLITFWYTIPIFYLGKHHEFNESDLTEPLEEHKSSILGEKLANLWSTEYEKTKNQHEVPNLTFILFKMFLKEIIIKGVWLFLMEIPFRLCQPLFLGLLLRYFSPENQNNTKPVQEPMYMMRLFSFYNQQSPIQMNEAIVFASGVIVCSLINVMVVHPCTMDIMHIGMKMRVACCSLIYRKSLRLNLMSLTGPTVGNVLNLISNDVSRFDLAVMYFHYIWIAPVQMLICLLLMYREVELASIIGISIILAVIPVQAWFGNRTSRFRLKTAYRTDERVRQMNEIIQAMQVIKMYTWEYAFAKQINNLRRQEIKVLKATSFIRATILSFMMFTSRVAIFVTVLAIIVSNDMITAEKVFVVTSFYQILRQTMTLFFPYAIAQIAETNVAVTRIKKFLLMPECNVGDPTPLAPQKFKKPQVEVVEPKVSLDDVTVSISNETCLENVSLTINNGEFMAIIGQVGAGKTCLLNTICGELEPISGSVNVSGVISYASQEPWLFSGSVRQNILFGRQFERERYIAVIRACALKRDFDSLPFGDDTLVGEKGATLSGGQKARINLARAVYKKADIYLLDDPLSAVDIHVGKQLFDECFTKFLSNKIVILVTHQLQFLTEIKKITLMHQGKIEAEGSYQFLETRSFEFSEFLRNQISPDAEQEEETETDKLDTIIKELKIKASVRMNVIDTEGIHLHKFKPEPKEEIQSHGSVDCIIYEEYFQAGGPCYVIFGVFVLFVGSEMLASGGDYFLANWVNVEQMRDVGSNTTSVNFLGYWDTNTYIGIYTVIILLTIVIVLARSYSFFIVCMRASVNLHDRMFQSIITAPMMFFTSNTSGRILNRFSKDLGAVDELLPNAMMDTFQIFLNVIGAIFVIAAIDFILLIPTVMLIMIFCYMRAGYISTSRSIKRLEGISRSPVYSHVTATLQGIVTIRSNEAEMLLVKEFDKLQDNHSSAWFIFIATARAFGYWLDLLCVVFIAAITFSFLLIESNGSSVGLAITTVIGLTGRFQWGIKQSAELENQMTSVERVLEFTKIEHEKNLESKPDKKPPSDWPRAGGIQVEDVVMKYKPADPPVLRAINFTILPKEKIGIVGRTGAGKSSLIAALFRLSTFDGTILIDEIDTKEIGLHDLRKKISIIPQEPVLFSGTLRYNMDPFNDYEDSAILDALLDVENKAALSEGIQCLNYHVSEGGVNISVGERQMICLARAILRGNKILVLDEATANIDPQTDQFIQTTIRKKFAHCTVLTIAHRLHTIMDSDKVLVVDSGRVAEYDHPHILLKNKWGLLSHMVTNTGPAMAQNLTDIARMNYNLTHGQS